MTYLPVSSGGLGGKPLRHALENCQARKTCGGEKRGALDGSWMGIGILPSSTRSDSRELHYAGRHFIFMPNPVGINWWSRKGGFSKGERERDRVRERDGRKTPDS